MTDFLFAQPSLAAGIARCLDIGGTFDAYNASRSPLEADARALTADFRAVGKDLAAALEHERAQREQSGRE